MARSAKKPVSKWVLVSLCTVFWAAMLLSGCGEQEDERPSLPPLALEARGATTMNAETQAIITLRGIPLEPISLEDESGQMWPVVSGGLENVGVGTHVLLEGGGRNVRPEGIASYHWALEAPAGSSATLDDPASRTPLFIPDLPGAYVVGLIIANDAGVQGRPGSLTIHAGTWVGNGSVRGSSDRYAAHQCSECHDDKLGTWRGTRHAITLRRAMDGQASPFYLENCVHCHTVGKHPLAVNGGFDDLARELGWTYPTELAIGNYSALVRDYPQLANLGNTQCETCHGPGSAHEDDDGLVAVSLRPELCIQCHDPSQHDRYSQWVRSGHADTRLPQIFPEGVDNPVCSSCHTTRNFIAAADGAEIVVGGDEYLSCQACHDPHEAAGANIYQVRYFGSARLPDGTNLPNKGASALCIHCHNVGETPEWVEHEYDPLAPPPQSAAAEMLAGVGGYTYGETLDDSPHATAFESYLACVDCHMASSTAEGAGDFLSASMNEPVGEHTFMVRYDNGTPADPGDDYENTHACAGCHGETPRINGPAAADYDGDGQAEGVQDEVQGLLDLVQSELVAAGVPWSDTAPYWGPAGTRDLRAAVYNWSYVNNDGSRGVHNTARAVELLQITYRQLAGREAPNAALRAGLAPESTLQQRFTAERSPLEGIAWPHIVIPLALLGLLVAVIAIVYRGIRYKES